jgi:hypothetical protein
MWHGETSVKAKPLERKNGGLAGRRSETFRFAVELDHVDFSWEVARDFQTNFGFANFRLHPGLHDVSPQNSDHRELLLACCLAARDKNCQ